MSAVAAEISSGVSAVATVVKVLSPTAGAVLSLLAVVIAEEPAIVAEVQALLGKATTSPTLPLNFARTSAPLATALDAK